MLRVRIAAALAGWLGFLLAPAMAAPLEAYGKLPTIEQVAISASGKHLATVTTNGEQRLIVVKEVATGKLVAGANGGALKVRAIRFAGDDHLLVVTSVTASAAYVISPRREWLLANLIDLKTGKIRPLMRDAEQSMNTVQGLPEVRTVNGEPVVVLQGVHFKSDRGVLSLFRINPKRGTSELLEAGSNDTIDWLVDPSGAPIAQEMYNDRSGRWNLRFRTRAGWRDGEVVEGKLERPYLMGQGRQPGSVLVGGYDGGWVEMQVADGVRGEAIKALDDQAPIFDPATGLLIGHYALVGDEPRYSFLDPKDERVWKAIVAAFPADRVYRIDWSDDRSKIIVLSDSPTDGPAYALVDLATKKATWLGPQFEGLTAADISPQQAIRYKAADGLELTGYLTMPRGKAAANLPLVVFVHGGPAARDTPGFDWWAQGMASRGYAVLQVNFRGSDGLGHPLLEAGYGQWGRKMQTDLSDGVRHLARQGIIDPARVCIVGASYGGYAALAGATLDRGVYRCAASVSGPSDLRRMVDWSADRSGHTARRYWIRFMGAKDLRDPVLGQISPAAFADKVEIPILMIHGRDDTVVPLEQSRIMAEALKKAGKRYELLVQPGEDHWLSRGETRLQTLKAVVSFLETHNPPT